MHNKEIYFLKKFVTFILILLISFSYCYETIEYFSQISGQLKIVWTDDISDGENENESKKTDDKDEKKEFKEYIDASKMQSLILLNQLSLSEKNHNFYAPSDYSIVVYSPPEGHHILIAS